MGKVFDGMSYSDAVEVAVTIVPVNDIPVVTNSRALSVNEDQEFAIPLALFDVSDPDNAFPQDFTLVVYDGANYSVRDGLIIPDKDFYGTLEISIAMNDGADASEPYNFQVDVLPVNDAPKVLGLREALTSPEDTQVTIKPDVLIIEDVDNVTADLRVIVLAGEHYSVNGNDITPGNNFNGKILVSVRVSDGIANSEVFAIPMDVQPVNDPPVIEGANRSFTSADGEPIALDVKDFVVVDPDNEFPVDHTLIVLNGDHYTFEGNIISPVKGFAGTLEVSIQISDGTDVSNTYRVEVTVEPVLAVEEHNLDGVTLYPNPNRGKFRLSLPSITERVSISISDNMGRKLYDHSITGSEVELDLQMAPGMYVLEMASGGKKVIRKFIVN